MLLLLIINKNAFTAYNYGATLVMIVNQLHLPTNTTAPQIQPHQQSH